MARWRVTVSAAPVMAITDEPSTDRKDVAQRIRTTPSGSLAGITRSVTRKTRVRSSGLKASSVLIGKRATQVLYTLFALVPFGIAVLFALLLYPVAWLSMLVLLAILPAILIVWTYREPRELVIALSLTSLASVGYAGLIYWALVA